MLSVQIVCGIIFFFSKIASDHKFNLKYITFSLNSNQFNLQCRWMHLATCFFNFFQKRTKNRLRNSLFCFFFVFFAAAVKLSLHKQSFRGPQIFIQFNFCRLLNDDKVFAFCQFDFSHRYLYVVSNRNFFPVRNTERV